MLLGVWFNQPYIQQRFAAGDRVAFAGKVELDYGFKQIKTPFVEKLAAEPTTPEAGRVLPVHRATEGLSTAWLRRLVAAAIDDFADVPDHLPADLRASRGLVPLHAALRDVHFPRVAGRRRSSTSPARLRRAAAASARTWRCAAIASRGSRRASRTRSTGRRSLR